MHIHVCTRYTYTSVLHVSHDVDRHVINITFFFFKVNTAKCSEAGCTNANCGFESTETAGDATCLNCDDATNLFTDDGTCGKSLLTLCNNNLAS